MTPVSRRTFLGGLIAASTAPALVRTMARGPRFPIGFSTLGCPKWPWSRVIEQAAQMGYATIELRGIEGEMDLTKRPELTGTRLAQTRTDLAALGLRISDLGASARMHESDPSKRAAQLDEGRRFIDLAHALGAPYVRVFGDQVPAGEDKQAVLARVVSGLRELGEHAKGSGVGVIIESHGDFTDSATLLELLKGAATPSVGLLWDAHHTFVAGKEQPAATFKALQPYIRHTHLKDSRPEGSGIRYVLTGTGTVPVRETVAVLARGGYKGVYCFEWEKAWHPEIEEPEVAFPHYADVMRTYLTEAGVKAA
jgi:sugar phosphate isomerase/epimerase